MIQGYARSFLPVTPADVISIPNQALEPFPSVVIANFVRRTVLLKLLFARTNVRFFL